MKFTIIGTTLLLMSAIVYGSTLIAASYYSQVLGSSGQGWDSRYGIFGTAIREVGTFPITTSFLLLIGGVFILILTTSKEWRLKK
ncbi:phosphatase [Filobacillus milosensis]|uniref:Phosphatase n=1 Tax=Filobacillus milosensis TaxID=94137 RepID=A0A4Y8INA1_9BACI|nr:phosphatase [Filobacillus milosensis]TFB22925.1 phosphatase [Filobacillus milosensis]